MLEWGAISFSRDLPDSGIEPRSAALQADAFTLYATREAPGSMPGLGRSTGEGIGYPLQYSWTSLVVQMVKNPPANAREAGLTPESGRSLEKEMATHFTILAWKIP